MSLKAEKIILDLLADGKEHSSDEIRRVLAQKGILSNRKYDVLRMSIYQLRKNGTEIYSRKRGVYQIEQKEKPDEIKKNYPNPEDFVIVLPEEKTTPKYLYIQEDGYIRLNGKLNREIKSRQIEIRRTNDAEEIMLIPDGENSHKFTKNGHVKNTELVKEIKKKYKEFPVVFRMEWYANCKAWVGRVESK